MTVSGKQAPDRHIALWAIFSLPLLWGPTFAIVQRALVDFTPMAFVVIRFGIAALMFLIVSKEARRGIRIFFAPKTRQERQFRTDMIVLGAAVGGGYIFQTIGLLTTTSSKSAFLTATTIIWTPILSVLLGRERLNRRMMIAISITLVGIFMMTHPFRGGGALVGDVLSVGCAMSFAVYILWIDIAMPRTRSIARNDHEAAMLITSTQIISSTLLFLILLPVIETPVVHLTNFGIGALLYTALAATTLTAYLQSRYQHHVSPTSASLIYMLEPVVAMVIAAIFLKEHLGLDELFGGGLILLGVIIAQIKSSVWGVLNA